MISKNRKDKMDKQNKNIEKKRRLRLVDKYDNNDISHYDDEPFQIGEEDFEHSAHRDKSNINLRPQGNWHHPGVSGKTDNGETWVNDKEYKKQTNFISHGPKGYKRSDDRIYEEVCETLMKNRDVDASNIGVKVETGVVYLSGKVNGRKEKKMAETIIEDLPGVQDVRNELIVSKGDERQAGPDASLKKDLGIN